MDNMHYRLTFDLDKKLNSRKEPTKVVKFQNLVENVVICGRYSLTKFANFLIVLRTEIVTAFGSKMVTIYHLLTVVELTQPLRPVLNDL